MAKGKAGVNDNIYLRFLTKSAASNVIDALPHHPIDKKGYMAILPLCRTLTKLQHSVRSTVNQHGQACQPISTATKTSNQPLSPMH